MSALDLTRLNTTIRRCAATLLDASYTDGIPTETTDVWRTIAADAARDLTDMIRRLRAAEARTAWQPIETAPRDGQRVTLYVVSPHWKRPELGLWHRGPEGTGWHQDAERSKLTRGTPTHWQPLPAAPEAP